MHNDLPSNAQKLHQGLINCSSYKIALKVEETMIHFNKIQSLYIDALD